MFGLNAARLYKLDVKKKRNAIKADKLTAMREEFRRNPQPSNTQYGWVWTDGRRKMTAPVGVSEV